MMKGTGLVSDGIGGNYYFSFIYLFCTGQVRCKHLNQALECRKPMTY